MRRSRTIAAVVLALSLLWHLAIPLVSLAQTTAGPTQLTLSADDGERGGVWVPRGIDTSDLLRDVQPNRLRMVAPRRGWFGSAGLAQQDPRRLECQAPHRGAYPRRQLLCATQARDGDPPA